MKKNEKCVLKINASKFNTILPTWGSLSKEILKKSRQKRWQKYNGLTYSEAVKLLEHWKWHSHKLEKLLENIIKNENLLKEEIDKESPLNNAFKKRKELLEKAEKILNSDVIWTGDY